METVPSSTKTARASKRAMHGKCCRKSPPMAAARLAATRRHLACRAARWRHRANAFAHRLRAVHARADCIVRTMAVSALALACQDAKATRFCTNRNFVETRAGDRAECCVARSRQR
eukprot:6171969-Pleurochrysis_carterae.AAC.2